MLKKFKGVTLLIMFFLTDDGLILIFSLKNKQTCVDLSKNCCASELDLIGKTNRSREQFHFFKTVGVALMFSFNSKLV